MSLIASVSQLVIQPDYPLIGEFTYSSPMTNCYLQESPNLKQWYDVPDDEVTVLFNGDWLIDTSIPHIGINGDIRKGQRMFFRIAGQSVTTNTPTTQ